MKTRMTRGPRDGNYRARWATLTVVALAIMCEGCSIRKLAVNKLGDALAQGGQTFSSDDDPLLVRDAAPFSLKLMESLLAENPRHRGLLLALTSGFTQYAYGFVQQEADRYRDEDLTRSDAATQRARRLYLRAKNYGLRGLEIRHSGFQTNLTRSPRAAVKAATRADVPLLYWTAAAWGAAISTAKDNPAMIGDQPIVEALIDRAAELDESWNDGAIHGFLIGYEMARQGTGGDRAARSRTHFARAVELSNDHLAGPYVSLAEAVALEQQNRAEFESLLNRALAIDIDQAPQHRLVNTIMQERARWLLTQLDQLFLPTKPVE